MGTDDLFDDLFSDLWKELSGSKFTTKEELFDHITGSEIEETYKNIFGELPEVASQEEQDFEELLLKMHKHRRENEA